MTADKKRMGDLHEEFLADLFGGRKSAGSGNQWADPADGRNDHTTQAFAFAWDGKSTTQGSITLNLENVLHKIADQAKGERPVIGVRFYFNERLDRYEDWVLFTADDVAEMLPVLRQEPPPVPESFVLVSKAEYEALQGQRPAIASVARSPQGFPRTVLYGIHGTDGHLVHQGVEYLSATDKRLFTPASVRIDQVQGRPRLTVDDVVVRNGELWIDGVLIHRIDDLHHA